VTRAFGWFLLLLVLPGVAFATDVVDATGRTVVVPDQVRHVLPAGPPAAVLMLAVAPDLMMGWPHKPDAGSLALLRPEAAALPEVPGLGHPEDVAKLHPDLILDYGNTTPHYVEQATKTQDETRIPTLLIDGRLAFTPLALRLVGKVLHRDARAEELARLVEGVLASVGPHREGLKVVYVHGADGGEVAVPQGANSELIEFLGWTLLAPPAEPGARGGAFRKASVAEIGLLDPDMIFFSNEAMRARVAASPEWRGLRAVREHHAWVSPSQPFGWMEGPPSLNRMVGLAWLADGAPHEGVVPLAALFYASVYGRVPTPAQINVLRTELRPVGP
jgi:iron complex transport system substrate-binding protein